MARSRSKSGNTEQTQDPNAWMTTFADLLMLLLTFFVLLLTMKSMEGQKMKDVIRELTTGVVGPLDFRQAQGVADIGQTVVLKKVRIDSKVALEDRLDSLPEVNDLPPEGGLSESLRELIVISEEKRGVIITLRAEHLFLPGQAQIRRERLYLLEAIGKLLASVTNEVLVMGHTDSVPLRSSQFESNWELSVYRALAVLYFLTDSVGLAGDHIAAGGYGDLMPVFPNTTPENRARNRRVEFVLRKR